MNGWSSHLQLNEGEDSFWPSFTDIMMVIVMIFLLVTVAVILTNSRLLADLRNSLQAEQQAAQLAEVRLRENATLEEQIDYYRQRAADMEMELLRSKASNNNLLQDLEEARQHIIRLQTNQTEQQTLLAQGKQAMTELQQERDEQRDFVVTVQRERDDLRTQLNTLTKQLQEKTTENEQLNTDVNALQASSREFDNRLQDKDQRIRELEARITSMTEQAEGLQTKASQADERLSSLQGEFEALDQRYQKLIRPARSSKDKKVVEVVYQSSGYRIKPPTENALRSVSKATLDAELTALKAQYGQELYVKIIIPNNSGLSYNEAWAFTRDTLNQYDYYYQQ